jgi:hypothetical protein
MSIVIHVENIFTRLTEAGVTDVPKRQYEIHDVDDFKVNFNFNVKTASIWIKTFDIDKPSKPLYVQIATFYPRGCSWTAVPRTDEWMSKFVRLLEATEALIVKEYQDGKSDS